MNAKHPYNYIPIDVAGLAKRRLPWPQGGPTGHERTAGFSGVMECVLETKTPLAIREGFQQDRASDDPRPRIRGSSLKGLVRATAQMMGAGCADRFLLTTEDGRADLSGMEACGPDSACPACRLFGYSPRKTGPEAETFGWAGKVQFHDSDPPLERDCWVEMAEGKVRLDGKFRRAFAYRKIDGAVSDKPRGWKVYLHSKSVQGAASEFRPPDVVRSGCHFGFRVEFESLTAEEFWVLRFALTLKHKCPNHLGKQSIQLWHKLGYGKGLGLGSCSIRAVVKAADKRRYFGESSTEFKDPECALEDYLVGEPVKAMRRYLDPLNAPDCVRFADGKWLREPGNETATIADWERELSGKWERGCVPTEFPPDPVPVFPSEVDAVVTRIQGGIAHVTTAFDEEVWRAQVPKSYGMKVGDRIRVTRTQAVWESRTFSGVAIG